VPDVAVDIAAVAATAGTKVVADCEEVEAAVDVTAGTIVGDDCVDVVDAAVDAVSAADVDVALGEVSLAAFGDVVHFTVAAD
jgi:hypothetical protein